MQNNPDNKPLALTEIERKKMKSWGDFGVKVHQMELSLSAMASKVVSKIQLPQTFEDIEFSRKLLAELKKEATNIKENRLTITRLFDKKTAELMVAENSLPSELKKLEDAIIKITKEHEVLEKKKKDKEAEVKLLRSYVIKKINEYDAAEQLKVSDLVHVSYKFALEKVSVEGLVEFKAKVLSGSKAKAIGQAYTCPIPELKLVTKDEFYEIAKNAALEPENALANYGVMLEQQFDVTFSDFHIALQNKEQALKIAEEDKKEASDIIIEQKENKDVAALIEGISTPVGNDLFSASTYVKPLKKKVEIDMEETQENAFIIMKAFVANMPLALPHVRIKNWFSFSLQQMILALNRIKKDDESFAPEGIVFKEVDKL